MPTEAKWVHSKQACVEGGHGGVGVVSANKGLSGSLTLGTPSGIGGSGGTVGRRKLPVPRNEPPPEDISAVVVKPTLRGATSGVEGPEGGVRETGLGRPGGCGGQLVGGGAVGLKRGPRNAGRGGTGNFGLFPIGVGSLMLWWEPKAGRQPSCILLLFAIVSNIIYCRRQST